MKNEYHAARFRAVKMAAYFLLFAHACIAGAVPVSADEHNRQVPYREFPPDTYATGRIIKVLDTSDPDYIESSEIIQKVRVEILRGEEKGKQVAAESAIATNGAVSEPLAPGQTVVIAKTYGVDGWRYYVTDVYRVPGLALIGLIFFALVIALGRKKGVTALIGLAFSVGLLAFYVVPRIMAGDDPLLVSLLGSLAIIFFSLYMAHGFSPRTTIAVVSSLITLTLSVLCAVLFVKVAALFGTGSEDALFLQLDPTQAINLRGLLLGGIIIGTLGVLDDVTVSQSAAVDELSKANPKLSVRELYRHGISVGREHIASLVNTLALAYAGASLPLFLLFILNNDSQPFWVVMNGQAIAEEVVRTLVGSVALILAVPISTYLAARHFARRAAAGLK